MVERPIKKSERQAIASDEVAANQSSTPESAQQQRSPIPQRAERKDKGGKKDRRKEGDERAKPGNPALMRGPKPAKFKPPVIETLADDQAETLDEVTPDVSMDEPAPEQPEVVQADPVAETIPEESEATAQSLATEPAPEQPEVVHEPVTAKPEQPATVTQDKATAEPEQLETVAQSDPVTETAPEKSEATVVIQAESTAEPEPEQPETATQPNPTANPSE